MSDTHRLTAAVIVASTRAARGEYEDLTGPVIQDWLASRGFEMREKVVVADGPGVGTALRAALDAGADVIITTGGTGITPSDSTPEQTEPLIEKALPGIAEAIRARGLEKSPLSLLSRGLAGMSGRTFIANLPGSRGGVKDGIAVIDPLLSHLLSQRDGGGHE